MVDVGEGGGTFLGVKPPTGFGNYEFCQEWRKVVGQRVTMKNRNPRSIDSLAMPFLAQSIDPRTVVVDGDNGEVVRERFRESPIF